MTSAKFSKEWHGDRAAYWFDEIERRKECVLRAYSAHDGNIRTAQHELAAAEEAYRMHKLLERSLKTIGIETTPRLPLQR